MTTNGDHEENPPGEVVCLFLVVVQPDGSSRVVLNQEERFIAQRLATPKDVFPALSNCLADFQGMKTAEALMSFQLAMQQQAAQQQPVTERDG